jgi:hypothetical protein
MGIPEPLRREIFKYRRTKSYSLDGILRSLGASPNVAASEAIALPAGTLPKDYDPIVAAYQDMEPAYDTPSSWFEGPVASKHHVQDSEVRFASHEIAIEPLSPEQQALLEIQQEIDLVKQDDSLPQFAREFADDFPGAPSELDFPTPDINTLLMMAELEALPNQAPAPLSPEPNQEFSRLEQIVMAEAPEPASPQPDYLGLTPELLQGAMQQAQRVLQTPQSETSEQQQLVYDPQLEEMLDPYRAMFNSPFNPFGMPGPG